jgi:hypothetical protein
MVVAILNEVMVPLYKKKRGGSHVNCTINKKKHENKYRRPRG